MVTLEPDIAIVGALAYDQIATTSATLSGQSQTLLNCKVDTLAEAFGGCGGNIAYNLAHMDISQPMLISVTGIADDARYIEHLRNMKINTEGLLRTKQAYCARAIIITDSQGHQFTAFFPGEVPSRQDWQKHLQSLHLDQCKIFVQAPYPPALMIESLAYAAQLPGDVLKICCPGQYADQLEASETQELINFADWIVGNAYEISHLEKACSLENKLVIQTNGAHAIHVTHPGGQRLSFDVPPAPVSLDPTGCGDAFLSSIASHLHQTGIDPGNENLADAITSACANAASCLAYQGGQQHLTRADNKRG